MQIEQQSCDQRTEVHQAPLRHGALNVGAATLLACLGRFRLGPVAFNTGLVTSSLCRRGLILGKLSLGVGDAALLFGDSLFLTCTSGFTDAHHRACAEGKDHQQNGGCRQPVAQQELLSPVAEPCALGHYRQPGAIAGCVIAKLRH